MCSTFLPTTTSSGPKTLKIYEGVILPSHYHLANWPYSYQKSPSNARTTKCKSPIYNAILVITKRGLGFHKSNKVSLIIFNELLCEITSKDTILQLSVYFINFNLSFAILIFFKASDEPSSITMQCTTWLELPLSDTIVRALILGEIEWSGQRLSHLHISTHLDVTEDSQVSLSTSGRLASVRSHLWSKHGNRRSFVTRNCRDRNFQLPPKLHGEPVIVQTKNVSITVTVNISCTQPKNQRSSGYCGHMGTASVPHLVLEIYERCRRSIFPRDLK